MLFAPNLLYTAVSMIEAQSQTWGIVAEEKASNSKEREHPYIAPAPYRPDNSADSTSPFSRCDLHVG